MSDAPAPPVVTPAITGAEEVINPPYDPPPGGADVAPPVVLEEPPDPEVVALIEETALPPDPRDPPAEPPPDPALAEPPVNVDVPNLSPFPEAVVGDTLICTMGNWNGQPTVYAYLWQSQMPGGTEAPEVLVSQGPTYLLLEKDKNKNITCTVTAGNDAGATAAPPSNSVLCKPAGAA